MRHGSKRGIRNKRGISTVVASILVLAITVALAVGLLTFGSSFMASQQKMQPPTTDQIKIENVYFDTSVNPNAVQVTIRNIGTGAVNVTDLYINGVHYAYLQAGGTGKFTANPNPNGIIQAGQAVTFIATSSQGNWKSGTAYTIMAATGNGGQNSYTATYSG
jgi:flagellin-like protein